MPIELRTEKNGSDDGGVGDGGGGDLQAEVEISRRRRSEQTWKPNDDGGVSDGGGGDLQAEEEISRRQWSEQMEAKERQIEKKIVRNTTENRKEWKSTDEGDRYRARLVELSTGSKGLRTSI
ncbi:hypothetical protein Ddye_005302 [Dipteronia dyeriana]|uniref:Uncharacterized protein n=1 Tax=Dipteronia dyeriana TaxID=168575 RepID=A0AAD9XG11_9ROSI|nr:hypothetical protein Ddye_005302 [Dipteronia dyeriana]